MMENPFTKSEGWTKIRFPFILIGGSGFGVAICFLGIFLGAVLTVTSGRAEPSATSLDQQINRVESSLTRIKMDIVHQYESDPEVSERINPSPPRSAPGESENGVQDKRGQADGTSQGLESNLKEIAVLRRQLESGRNPSGPLNGSGPVSSDEIRLQLADRLLRAGLGSQAEPILKDLVIKTHRPPISAEGWFQLEKLYYRRGDYRQALGAYLKIRMTQSWSRGPEATYLAGNSYLYLKDYLKAVDLLGNIGEGNEYYPFAVYSSGLAYLSLGDAWSSTQLQFQKLIALNPGKDPVLQELIYKTRVTLGFVYLDQKRYPEALSVLEAVPPQSRYRAQARFGIGKAFMGMGDCVKAIVVFKDLIEQSPVDSYALEAHLQIGTCYSKLSAYHRAVDSYQEALEAYAKQSESFEKLTAQIQTTKLENWPDLARDHGFSEPLSLYADWYRLNQEINGEVKQGGHAASHGPDRGPVLESKALRGKLQDAQQNLIKLFRVSAFRHLSSQRAQIDELALRANLGIAKNMTFMQAHETVP